MDVKSEILMSSQEVKYNNPLKLYNWTDKSRYVVEIFLHELLHLRKWARSLNSWNLYKAMNQDKKLVINVMNDKQGQQPIPIKEFNTTQLELVVINDALVDKQLSRTNRYQQYIDLETKQRLTTTSTVSLSSIVVDEKKMKKHNNNEEEKIEAELGENWSKFLENIHIIIDDKKKKLTLDHLLGGKSVYRSTENSDDIDWTSKENQDIILEYFIPWISHDPITLLDLSKIFQSYEKNSYDDDQTKMMMYVINMASWNQLCYATMDCLCGPNPKWNYLQTHFPQEFTSSTEWTLEYHITTPKQFDILHQRFCTKSFSPYLSIL
jgi:hypothetical protein